MPFGAPRGRGGDRGGRGGRGGGDRGRGGGRGGSRGVYPSYILLGLYRESSSAPLDNHFEWDRLVHRGIIRSDFIF